MVAASAQQREQIADLVSVVIPAYNAQKSVARAIEHALGQTYPQIEVSVEVDD